MKSSCCGTWTPDATFHMKIRHLRWLDKSIGLFLCAGLFLPAQAQKVFAARQKFPSNGSDVTRILVIKFFGLGSIVLGFDFFCLLRKKYPSAHICAFTFEENKSIFEMTGIFDEVRTIGVRTLTEVLEQGLKVLADMRRKRFNFAFDLEFTSRLSAAFLYLTNATHKIGFKYKGVWRGDFLDGFLEFREDVKLRKSILELGRFFAAQEESCPQPLVLRVNEDDGNAIERIFSAEGLNGAYPIIGVNINASDLCESRKWPQGFFVALMDKLIKKYSAHILLIGSAHESAYVGETLKKMSFPQNAHNFSGRASFPQLVYLMRKMHLFISNDSGPLHLAVYLGIPTVSFFGPETPLIYGPEGDLHTVFYRNLSCSPCIRIKKYKFASCAYGQRCLREITAQQVFNEIERKGLF
jgi:ADP-heptose:LPS heptosyltransferase